jgi:septation ring formation regulator EzrA
MSPSASEILFILLIVGIMAVPPTAVAIFVWRKVYRRIDRLEQELDELRDLPPADDPRSSSPRLRDDRD